MREFERNRRIPLLYNARYIMKISAMFEAIMGLRRSLYIRREVFCRYAVGSLTDKHDWVVQQSRTCNSSGCYEVWERAGTYYTFFNDKLQSFTEISP